MAAEPEYAMLFESLTTFRDSAGFHLMDETPLPDALANPLWEAFHLVRGVIDQLVSDHGCVEGGVAVFAPPSVDEADG